MTDRNRRLLLAVVLFVILLGFAIFLIRVNHYNKLDNIQTKTEQAIKENEQKFKKQDQKVTQSIKTYKELKKANDKMIQEAGCDAVEEYDTNATTDVLLDFSELVQRAKSYNDSMRGKVDK